MGQKGLQPVINRFPAEWRWPYPDKPWEINHYCLERMKLVVFAKKAFEAFEDNFFEANVNKVYVKLAEWAAPEILNV